MRISGAKNAVLPEMAAFLMLDGPGTLRNVPAVRDVSTMTRVLQHLGLRDLTLKDGVLRSAAGAPVEPEAPYGLVRTMRASILVLGPLLARLGRAKVSLPGGCAIGARPIDLHIEALRRWGADRHRARLRDQPPAAGCAAPRSASRAKTSPAPRTS